MNYTKFKKLSIIIAIFGFLIISFNNTNNTNNTDIPENSKIIFDKSDKYSDIKTKKVINKKFTSENLLKELKQNNLNTEIVQNFFNQKNKEKISKNINNYKYININYLNSIKEINFFADYGLSTTYSQQKKLKQMQNLAKHIELEFKKPKDYAEKIVVQAAIKAKKHNLSYDLVLAIIATESSFQTTARSHKNAQGLMQVIKKWHPDEISLLKKQKIDPDSLEGSIELGSMVLAKYLKEQKYNEKKALLRYNGSIHDKTEKYAKKVYEYKNKFTKIKNT